MENEPLNVRIGSVFVGPSHPVLIQSMCNVPTLDTTALVEQCKGIFDAGAALVRISTRNLEEARNLQQIRRQLNEQGYEAPLCADVHFSPPTAYEAARWVEKVRINPGNFSKTDPVPPLKKLLDICQRHETALRIGVNHGSLSERMMERFGDTPEGMVASAMEYLEICREAKFHQVVVSLKSSNTRIMVYANRMMFRRMQEAGLSYPLHLGVTEAGDGMDGRIRSAAGIGTLLNAGLGATIRVSLTEAPEQEIPVAEKLIRMTTPGRMANSMSPEGSAADPGEQSGAPESYQPRNSISYEILGGNQVPVVVSQPPAAGSLASGDAEMVSTPEPPDYIFLPDHRLLEDLPTGRIILNADVWIRDPYPEERFFPLYTLDEFVSWEPHSARLNFVLLAADEVARAISVLPGIDHPYAIVFLHDCTPQAHLRFLELTRTPAIRAPLLIRAGFMQKNPEDLWLEAAAALGGDFLDGQADGLWLDAPFVPAEILHATVFRILQACRSRLSETEYIACPSCGRTQFDIQGSLQAVKQATSHLRHLKIAVMGCLVNGPGEMADADYGYVGSGKGKVSLYRGKEMVKKHIPAEKAVRELVHLIKSNDDWKEDTGTHRN